MVLCQHAVWPVIAHDSRPEITPCGDCHDYHCRPFVPHQSASLPELRAADRGVASSLESVISKNTRRVYGTQWRLFDRWCADVGLTSRPADPLTVARYLAQAPIPAPPSPLCAYRVTKEGIDLRIAT